MAVGAGEEVGRMMGPGGVSGKEAGGLGRDGGPWDFCHEIGITKDGGEGSDQPSLD